MQTGRSFLLFLALCSPLRPVAPADSITDHLDKYTDTKQRLLPIGAQRLPSDAAFDELGKQLEVIAAFESEVATKFIFRELIGSERLQPRLAAVAARALLRKGGDVTFGVLVRSFADRAAEVQVEILAAFATTERDIADLWTPLLKGVRMPLSPAVRAELPKVLQRFGTPLTAQILLGHAASPTEPEAVRAQERFREATETALRSGDETTKRWLASRALSRTPAGTPARTLLMELCGALSLVAAEPGLENEVALGRPEHAAAAIDSLLRLRVDPERVAERVRSRKDQRDSRFATGKRLRALVEPKSAGAFVGVKSALESANPLYSLLAVRGVLRSRREAQALVAGLDHEDAEVRGASWRALVLLRERETIGPLIDFLDTSSSSRRESALSLLRDLTRKDFGSDATSWVAFWERARDSFRVPPPGQVASTVVAAQSLSYFGIEVIEGRLIFLIDVSASMKGEKIAALRRELGRLLRSLTPRSEINIVAFKREVSAWKGRLVSVNGAARASALEYLNEQTTGGGTNLSDALTFALSHDRLDAVYVLTDGRPTVGAARGTEEILRLVGRKNRRRQVRIHTIAFGKDSDLLRRLARTYDGVYRRVTTFREKESAR